VRKDDQPRRILRQFELAAKAGLSNRDNKLVPRHKKVLLPFIAVPSVIQESKVRPKHLIGGLLLAVEPVYLLA
jgi:hypothetical protein